MKKNNSIMVMLTYSEAQLIYYILRDIHRFPEEKQLKRIIGVLEKRLSE